MGDVPLKGMDAAAESDLNKDLLYLLAALVAAFVFSVQTIERQARMRRGVMA
jgi:hypothetical protein